MLLVCLTMCHSIYLKWALSMVPSQFVIFSGLQRVHIHNLGRTQLRQHANAMPKLCIGQGSHGS